ncbi:hypothetical protein PLICRDRAFT_701051 [Plicaturopsis crispa FD-325 SS-3]|nr:hypothetical protein PLICRDRAFT_701051 [Plicaturopsis crispa FD-325 SS-3]
MSLPHRGFTTVRDYVSRAILPSMVHTRGGPPVPPEDCRSERNPAGGYLNPGGYHLLAHMHKYDQYNFENSVKTFHDSIADKMLDISASDEFEDDLTIYVDGILDEFPLGKTAHMEKKALRERHVTSDEDVSRRAVVTIFTTASSIYRQLFPSAPHRTFERHLVYGEEPQYFKPYIYAEWKEGSFTNALMAVFIVPPWYLAPRDLQDFTNASEFEKLPIIPGKSPDPNQKRQHYWAMVDDICYVNGIRHFAMTTYAQWVFGCFSDDWKHASISETRGHRTQSPTILETFLYWMHCGLDNVPGMTPSQDSPNSPDYSDSPSPSTQYSTPVPQDSAMAQDILCPVPHQAGLPRLMLPPESNFEADYDLRRTRSGSALRPPLKPSVGPSAQELVFPQRPSSATLAFQIRRDWHLT